MLNHNENIDSSVKEHYKMYKAGKKWVFAGIYAAVLSFGGFIATAHADTTSEQPQVVQTQTVNTKKAAPASSSTGQISTAGSQASVVSTTKSMASNMASQASTFVANSETAKSVNTLTSERPKASNDTVTLASRHQTVSAVDRANQSTAGNGVQSQAARSATLVASKNSAVAKIDSVKTNTYSKQRSYSTVQAKSVSSTASAFRHVSSASSHAETTNFLVETQSQATSASSSNVPDSNAPVPVNVAETQTKVYGLDHASGDVMVTTNGTYDSTGFATSPLSVAVYAPYTGQTTNTFGDQNTIDTFDNVQAGRMLVKITNHQTTGFDVDIPIYSDTAQKMGLAADDVGKYFRFKFTQAKQLIGTPVNADEPYNQYMGSLLDANGNVLEPAAETKFGPVPVLSTTTPDPDTSLSDTDLKKSLDSNIFTDSVAKDFFKSFNLSNLPQEVLTYLNGLVITDEKTYQKPVVEPDGKIKYQNPIDGPVHIVTQAKINPDSLPGSNDNSTATTPYVPVNNYVTDAKTGKVSEVLVGYAKQADYEGSGGLNYTLVDAPNDEAKVIGDVDGGKLTPSTVKRVQMTVTFVTTDGSTNVPAKQTPTVNIGTNYDYQNVIVPDLATGYQIAQGGQNKAITIVADSTQDNYIVKVEPISEPVTVKFTAASSKGQDKAKTIGTDGTYTTNAPYNSAFGKDQLSGVQVPAGYSLDSVTPTNKVGKSGTNNYTATIVPNDETVTLNYKNTDGIATTMATDTPTTATAKMDSQFGATNIATKPTEKGYSVAATQSDAITVGTTDNTYTLQYSPDSEPINVSFVADNGNTAIAALKVSGDVKANYNSKFGITNVKGLTLPTFTRYEYATYQNADITVGTENNNYVVKLVAQDETGTVQVIRSDDTTKTVQQSIPFTAKMDSTFGFDKVPTDKITNIPGYSLEAASKQASGTTIGTDATKNIYTVLVSPNDEDLTLELVKTNDTTNVYSSVKASAKINSSYGITQATADLAKFKLEIPTGYTQVADDKQAASETIKTTGNVYKVLIAPNPKTVSVSVGTTNNVALNIPAFTQASFVDKTFGFGQVDSTKFTIPAGYQLASKNEQAKDITINNDESKDTYQVLLEPKSNTKVTVKAALTKSGTKRVTLPAEQTVIATTDTKYTLADALKAFGDKLTISGYHVATATEKADPDVTVAGDGASIFTVYLAPDSETLNFKFKALDNTDAADDMNVAKFNISVPFNSIYTLTGHEKGLPTLPAGYGFKSYPSAEIEDTKSNTMTVEIQKKVQSVQITYVSNQPQVKLPAVAARVIQANVDSTIGLETPGIADKLTGTHYHVAAIANKVNQPQTVKPDDNNYIVTLTPDTFSKSVRLMATVRDENNQWRTISLTNLTLNGFYGQKLSKTTPTVDGYTGETLDLTLDDQLGNSILTYVGQEAHLAVHHYLIDAQHHIIGELGTVGNVYGTVGGHYDIPADQIPSYHLVSVTGDPTYTVADEATKGNAINLYYIKLPNKTTLTPAPQATIQIAPNAASYVVTGVVDHKEVSFVAQPVVRAIPVDIQGQSASRAETIRTPELSETTQSTTTKQPAPSVAMPLVKSSNKTITLDGPQTTVKSNDFRPVKTGASTGMKHAQSLPQTNERYTGILSMIGAGLMSLLAVLGIFRKRRD